MPRGLFKSPHSLRLPVVDTTSHETTVAASPLTNRRNTRRWPARGPVAYSPFIRTIISMDKSTLRVLAFFAMTLLIAASCGSSADSATGAADRALEASGSVSDSSPGIRLLSPQNGAAIQNNPPKDLVILDVRTPEEFAEGHLDGAVMIDFYRDDFADQLTQLDPDVPYLVYCRSGNRSGQTAAIMEQLGFTDVVDVDGGILSWTEAGLPTVTP